MKWIKKKYGVLLGLWQSKNKNYANMYMGAVLFFFLSCVHFFFIKMLNNNNELLNCIAKVIFRYLCIFFISMTLVTAAWAFYVNNSVKRIKNAAKIVLPVIIVISLVGIIVSVAFFISAFLIAKMLELRAGKIDNWINFLMIVLILLGGLCILLYPDFIISLYLIKGIALYLNDKWNLYIDSFSPILFTIITLLIGESYLIVAFLIWILKCKLRRIGKERLKSIENMFRQSAGSKIDDLSEYMKNKQDKIKQEKRKIRESGNCDIEYIQNSIKRIWLIILVLIFIGVIFKICPMDYIGDMEKYQSDIINVLTIYTLILTYLDKMKEWK